MHNFVVFPSKKEIELVTQNADIKIAETPRDDYQKIVCIKPWGHEFLCFESKKIGMWCLTVTKENTTSLHCHFKKDTLLFVLSGCAKIGLFDGSVKPLSLMESLYIPKNTFHSIGSFSESCTLLEIEIFSNQLDFSDKNDLLRINDKYHRKSVGYQSSVELRREGLEEYGYFDFRTSASVHLDGIHMEMKRVQDLSDLPKNTHCILIEGSVFKDNSLLKEGTILSPNHLYHLFEPVLILVLEKNDWKEDCKVIYGFEHLRALKQSLDQQKKKLILTSGCYDVLHIGHLHTLKNAKALGDILIVCLSSDEQIRALKGETRPINKFEDRLDLFKTIEYVDYIMPYQEEYIETEETLGKIMKILDPDVWVKGSDYTVQKILEKHPYLRSIHLVPLVENRSTTNIIKKITGRLKQ